MKATKRNLMDSMIQLFTKGPGRMELNIFRDIYRIFQMNMDRVDVEYVESFFNKNPKDVEKLKKVWDRLTTSSSKLEIKDNIFYHLDEKTGKILISLIYSIYKSGSFNYIIKSFKKQYPTMNFDPQISELVEFFKNDKFNEFYKTDDNEKREKLSKQLYKDFYDMAKNWSDTYSLNLSICLVHYLIMSSRIINGFGFGMNNNKTTNAENNFDIKFEDILDIQDYRTKILTDVSKNKNAKLENMYSELRNGYNINDILTVEITKIINKFILSKISGVDVNDLYESIFNAQTGIIYKINLDSNIKSSIGKYLVSGECELMDQMGYTVDDVIYILQNMIFPDKDEMEFKQILSKLIEKRG